MKEIVKIVVYAVTILAAILFLYVEHLLFKSNFKK